MNGQLKEIFWKSKKNSGRLEKTARSQEKQDGRPESIAAASELLIDVIVVGRKGIVKTLSLLPHWCRHIVVLKKFHFY